MVRERGASRPPSLFAAWDNPKPMFCCGGEQAIANPTEKRGRQEAIVEVFGGVARRRTQIGTRPRERLTSFATAHEVASSRPSRRFTASGIATASPDGAADYA